MKITRIKQWKQKHRMIHRRQLFKKTGKFKNKRNGREKIPRRYLGKYVILLSKRKAKYGAILKFVTNRLCRVEKSFLVDRTLIKQTSSKYIITPKRNQRLLKKVEVIFTKKNVEDFKSIVSLSMNHGEKKEKFKTITPIKIFSCMTCNHKFTRLKDYKEHMETHVVPGPPSSDSEGEMVIDDDCVLILDNNDYDVKSPGAPINLKEDPDEVKPEEHYCMVEDCGKKFDSEEFLVTHVASVHDRHEDRPFKCPKCGDGFKRESGLVAHDKMKHAVETLDLSEDDGPPKRRRRKSVFVSSEPKVNGLAPALEPCPGPSSSTSKQDIQPSVSFTHFSSIKKTTFICHICSTLFHHREYLDRHVLTQHIVKSFNCFKCNVSLERMTIMRHLKSAHLDNVTEPEFAECLNNIESTAVFKCCFCRFSVEQRARVSEHLLSEHYEEFEKHESSENASSPDSLEDLVLPETAKLIENDLLVELPAKQRTNESGTRRQSNDPSFKHRCVHCSKRYSRISHLQRHACIKKKSSSLNSQGTSKSSSQDSSPIPSSSRKSLVQETVKVATVKLPVRTSQALNIAKKIFAPIVKRRSSTTASVISQMRNNAKSQNSTGFYGCQMCPTVFTDKEMFKDHTLTAHKTSNPKSSSNGY